jgi:hypothetical protein
MSKAVSATTGATVVFPARVTKLRDVTKTLMYLDLKKIDDLISRFPARAEELRLKLSSLEESTLIKLNDDLASVDNLDAFTEALMNNPKGFNSYEFLAKVDSEVAWRTDPELIGRLNSDIVESPELSTFLKNGDEDNVSSWKYSDDAYPDTMWCFN